MTWTAMICKFANTIGDFLVNTFNRITSFFPLPVLIICGIILSVIIGFGIIWLAKKVINITKKFLGWTKFTKQNPKAGIILTIKSIFKFILFIITKIVFISFCILAGIVVIELIIGFGAVIFMIFIIAFQSRSTRSNYLKK